MDYRIQPYEPRKHREGAIAALSRAFYDDPLICFIAPHPEERRRWLPVTIAEIVRCGLPELRSRVLISDQDQIVAAMIAGSYPPSLGTQLRQQVMSLLFPLPWVPNLRHLFKVFRYVDDWQEMHFHEPHHYVYMLGVDPAHQHCGLGRRLMQSLSREADAEGMPVYLETVTESNVRFYESLGFAITEIRRSYPDGPNTWGMLRKNPGPESDSRDKS